MSWYRPHLETSLALIDQAARGRNASVIDVGGGESTLVDDLLSRPALSLTVLDISRKALDKTKNRLGHAATRVEWIAGDVTQAVLPAQAYDIWHDRAVFHFLTSAADRAAYVAQVRRTVRPGGYVIVSAFGPEGPAKCSGLDVVRYDDGQLHGEFGSGFRLLESQREIHMTPWGTPQQFVYCFCRADFPPTI
ncbi:MAG: class I SAM-dependent methyltransferase [Bryobacteraceae bacterium]|nr:class I SAM-dependent methyltransferase [Bryobacteraceae bacterium]